MERFVVAFKAEGQSEKQLEIKTKACTVKNRAVKTWSAEEDERLISLHDRFPKKWNLISEQMENRNENQCLHRYRRICQLGQNKKIWSAHEDQTVLRMIRRVGFNWKIIALTLGSKTGKQIRERFINKLDPNIKKNEWSEEEDLKLIEMYAKIGSKWCEISKHLPGRPENRIKNRFYSFIQKKYDFKVKDLHGAKSHSSESSCKREEVEEQFSDKQNASGNSLNSIGIHLKSSQKNSMPLPDFRQRENIFQNLSEEGEGSMDGKKEKNVRLLSERQIGKESSVKEEENSGYGQFGEFNQSMKQINEECFFQQNRAENQDLLYFEDE